MPADEPAGPTVPGENSTPGGPESGASGSPHGAPPAGGADGAPPATSSQGVQPAVSPEGAPPGASHDGPTPGGSPDGAPPAAATGDQAPAQAPGRAGRNLPAALAVGVLLGGLALVTLFTVKATFLVYLAAAVGIASWELSRALGVRDIRFPLVPVAVGGIAAIALAYWRGERSLVACIGITMIVILAWRLPGSTAGYLRDVTAGVFVLIYLPLMASFVALMLAEPDGSRRTLVLLILGVCSDIGGYAAGVLIGRHLMVPTISPKKTWEGFGGSALACMAAGAIALPLLLHGAVWQGLLLGVAALLAATLGDLVESMIKRDLQIKDMGTVLPGHGGVLDRIDSLALAAPVVWLLLLVFVPVAGHH